VRSLQLAPRDALDPATLAPRFGSYRGSPERIELARLARGPLAPLVRIARHKRWFYLAIASEPLLVGLAVVRLGYASNAFAFVYQAGERRMLVDASSMGPPSAARVGDSTADGILARYRFGRFGASITGDGGGYTVAAAARGLDLRARLDAVFAPPSITAIAPLPGNRVAVTEKRALLAVSGEMTVAGQRFALDGGLAAYDYTQGLLARRTAWRWAFALGLAKNGEPFALNLVQGHVGQAECAAWTRDGVHPLAEGRFEFEPGNRLAPWQVTTADGQVDLRFSPGAIHAETKDLGVIRSRFVQPVGTYEGTVRLGNGRSGNGASGNGPSGNGPSGNGWDTKRPVVEVQAMLGVAEDQDVLW
jgi:hypothetical protein